MVYILKIAVEGIKESWISMLDWKVSQWIDPSAIVWLMDSLTSQVSLFPRLPILRGQSEQFLQCLVPDVRGTPFWDNIPGKIATKLHRGSSETSLRYETVIR
jgi:hypothetical protein